MPPKQESRSSKNLISQDDIDSFMQKSHNELSTDNTSNIELEEEIREEDSQNQNDKILSTVITQKDVDIFSKISKSNQSVKEIAESLNGGKKEKAKKIKYNLSFIKKYTDVIKNFFRSLKGLDKKDYLYIGIAFLALILFFVIISFPNYLNYLKEKKQQLEKIDKNIIVMPVEKKKDESDISPLEVNLIQQKKMHQAVCDIKLDDILSFGPSNKKDIAYIESSIFLQIDCNYYKNIKENKNFFRSLVIEELNKLFLLGKTAIKSEFFLGNMLKKKLNERLDNNDIKNIKITKLNIVRVEKK